MGLFDFFKKKSNELEKQEKIKLDYLEEWLDSQIAILEENIKPELKRINYDFTQEKDKLVGNLKVLETAEIKNPNIPERMKHVMQGNRDIFLQRMDSLIEMMNFPQESLEVHKFSLDFDGAMHDFSRSIAKSHNVMQEFLPKEAGSVTVSVTNIDKIIKSARKVVEESGFDKFDGLRKEIKEIISKLERKNKGEEEIEDLEKSSKEIERSVRAKKIALEEIEESEDYLGYKNLVKEVEELEEEKKKKENSMKHVFSEIEAGLRRYSSLNKGDKIAKEYLSDPIKALMRDGDFEIVETIKKVENYLSDGSIGLKDKKKDVVLKEIKEMNKKYFEEYVKNIKNAEKKIEKNNDKIAKSRVVARMNEMKEQISEIQKEFENSKAKMEKTLEEMGSINIDKMINELEKAIMARLKKDVKILI